VRHPRTLAIVRFRPFDTTPVRSLAEYGQVVWLDAPPYAVGDLAGIVERHAIAGIVAGADDAPVACDLMLDLWLRTGGRDGHVCSEALDDRPPNLLVRIPPARTAAIEGAVAAGASVDITPTFSPALHREAIEACARGVERLIASGGDPRAVTAVTGIPLAPVDAEVDRRLSGPATGLRGRLAIANARLAYRTYKDALASPRWRALGAQPPRCLWLSTTPAAAYSDVLYVEQLIGADTVVAMAPETIDAFEDHGIAADRLDRDLGDAQRIVDAVRAAGVDLDEVWRTLQARWPGGQDR
jgi:hypothetical protein